MDVSQIIDTDKNVAVLFGLLAALWATVTIIQTLNKELNNVRDKILMGSIEGERITPEHRRLLYSNDWLPYFYVIASLCLIFAIVAILVPCWLHPQADVYVFAITCVIAVFYVLSFIAWLLGSIQDMKMLRRVTRDIDNEKDNVIDVEKDKAAIIQESKEVEQSL